MRKQIELTCFNCGKHFQRAVSTRKQAMQRGKSTPFCSKECSEVLQNTKITLKCSCCGKRIKRPNAEVLKSKTRRFSQWKQSKIWFNLSRSCKKRQS